MENMKFVSNLQHWCIVKHQGGPRAIKTGKIQNLENVDKQKNSIQITKEWLFKKYLVEV